MVIPEQMKAEFLERAHDKGGHQGVEKTLDRLKMIAYWVGMQLAVTEYVNSCDRCQKAKLPLPTRAPLLNTPLGRPLQMLQVDVLEVPISSQGNRYLLVIEDSFSNWLEAYPIKDQRAETITKLLTETFSRLGIPEFLHSDQGTNFESTLLKEHAEGEEYVKHTLQLIILRETPWWREAIEPFYKCSGVMLTKLGSGKDISP